MLAGFDEVYSASINQYMCTDFCICPGLPTDPWYQEYARVPSETYAKYNRTFLGFTGEIDFERYATADAKVMFWAFDPTTGQPNHNLAISSESMLDVRTSAYSVERLTGKSRSLDTSMPCAPPWQTNGMTIAKRDAT